MSCRPGLRKSVVKLKGKRSGLYVKDMFGTHVSGQRSNFVKKVKVVSGNVCQRIGLYTLGYTRLMRTIAISGL